MQLLVAFRVAVNYSSRWSPYSVSRYYDLWAFTFANQSSDQFVQLQDDSTGIALFSWGSKMDASFKKKKKKLSAAKTVSQPVSC